MNEQIRSYFNRYVAFEDKEIEAFCQCLEAKTFQKREYLLREGEICHYKYFITKGLTRSFYIDDKGNEKIIQFAIENWWVTNIESFVRESPAKINIQAVEETHVLAIKRMNLEKLYVAVPKLERLFRMLTENMLMAIQRRYEFYQKLSSKERYENMVNALPDFVQRVPQYMIASYLEITPEYLSELRKKK